MRAVCLGGDLDGFAGKNHAEGPYDLSTVISQGERVILVCHGAPYAKSSEPGTESVISPELQKYHIHALLIAHRAEPASPIELSRVRNDLRPKCERIFGLTLGWDKIRPPTRDRILEFAGSEDATPQDPEVQGLLGYHSPLTRLAMRVGLEIALRELEGGSRLATPGADMPPAVLLAPALTIGESEPSLNAMALRIKSGLGSGREALGELVSQALTQFRK
jgi:hypothetical protein